MSNVLIGIIGVILFIGLALAGALILGDDFKSANSSSKASAIVSTLQQVSQAANMYQLKRGVVIPSSTAFNITQLLADAKSLKSAVVNPYNGLQIFVTDAGGGHSPSPAKFIYTNIGYDPASANVCRAIEEIYDPGIADGPMAVSHFGIKTVQSPRMGCLLNGDHNPAIYQAYIPI